MHIQNKLSWDVESEIIYIFPVNNVHLYEPKLSALVPVLLNFQTRAEKRGLTELKVASSKRPLRM